MKTTFLLVAVAAVVTPSASAIIQPATVSGDTSTGTIPKDCDKDRCPGIGELECRHGDDRYGCLAAWNEIQSSPAAGLVCKFKRNCWTMSDSDWKKLMGHDVDIVARDTGCCFHLSASGGGLVGQLDDGQNRIRQNPPGLPTGEYCLNGQGGLVDSHGRGCILTPPTSQWQCDAGAKPTPGFSVGPDGTLTYNSSTQFFTCPTGDNGGWNLYENTLLGEPKCEPVKLVADSCKATTPPTSTAPPAVPSKCPAELPEHFEFPHYIKPISTGATTSSYSNSYNGTAGSGLSSIFNFDIPQSYKGQLCNIKFLFPQQQQLETSAYTYGSGVGFKFALLDGPATETTTYDTAPKVHTDFGTFQLTPGGAYDIASIACPAGEKLSVWFEALGTSYLDFFQDSNPCPIGLYITSQ